MPDAGKSQRLGARLPQEKPRPGFGPLADEAAFPRLTEAEITEAACPNEWPLPLETMQRWYHPVHNFLGRTFDQHSIHDRGRVTSI
jgi:hypothetical protein